MASRPRLIWWILKLSFAIPEAVYWYACRLRGIRRHDQLLREMKANLSHENGWRLVEGSYGGVVRMGWKVLEALASEGGEGINTHSGVNLGSPEGDRDIRIFTVAGGLEDDVESTRKMGAELRQNYRMRSAKAAVANNAVHPWDLQFPELFAKSIKACIEGGNLPHGLEELEGTR